MIDENDDENELLKRIQQFPDGAILIATATETQYLPAMKKASGIITEEGSALSHAAIVSREIGIPCIAGYANAKEKFPTGTKILLDASNGKIIANEIKEELNKNSSFNFGELYCFDNIVPMEIGDTSILLEHTMEGVVAHIPEDADIQLTEKIEQYVRIMFKKPPIFCQTPKYLWYFELKRFEQLPRFNETVQYAKKIAKNKNCNKINSFYNLILSRVKELVEYKKQNNISNLEEVYIDEICMANHFILDALLPNGFAELEAYNETLTPLYKRNANFNDLLNKRIENIDNDEILKKNYDFLQCISKNRNEICQKFVQVGAMSFDYFETREQRMIKALDNKVNEEKVIDVFYEQVEKINNTEVMRILTNKKKKRQRD